jgi:hypothetical protein
MPSINHREFHALFIMSKYKRMPPNHYKERAKRIASDDRQTIASLPSSINSKSDAKRGKLAIRIEHGTLTYRGRSWVRRDP